MTVQSSQKLTKRIVETSAPSADRFVLWDSELKGFGLRIETTGTKTFIVRYRAAGGRSGIKRLVSLGRFGVITVEQARVSARQVLGAVAQGKDPAADRAKQREIWPTTLCALQTKLLATPFPEPWSLAAASPDFSRG